MTARRIVSIWFPQLAMERWRRAHRATDDSLPLALVSEQAHGMVIDAANAAAGRAGVQAGQRLADARAVYPALLTEPSDLPGDALLLEKFARWSQRWSPWTCVEGSDGLLLDSTGAAHCFGGEAALLEQVGQAFAGLGFTARLALAPTIGAAWALARFGPGAQRGPGPKTGTIVTPQGLAKALAPLPIESLRLEPDAVLLLKRLGLKTLGGLADIPAQSLARRFRKRRGEISNPLKRLQQAYGQVEEVVAPLAPQAIYRAAQRVSEPVRHLAVLQPILADLARDLCRALEERQRGLRRVRFEAFRVDGHVARIEVETAAPVRCPDHVLRLFGERLETLDAGFGFDAFVLLALWDEAMEANQQRLDEEQAQGISLPHLLDRLRMRLGAENIRLPAPYASHVPERSIVWRGDSIPLPFAPEREHDRPIRLFDRPEPVTVIYATPDGPPRRFRWRRRLHDVARSEGPERIAPEWWRERSDVRLRDYYKVEDSEGRRYWIYRNGVIDDGRGGPPQWFMHGLFA